MSKVSVLVAVYNSENYIRECIDSLISQTLHDIQIIAIDDCSSDNSLHILNEYAANDDRIRVITLSKNGGQAHARNVGLKIADGDFICMVDSDDWLSDDALQKAVDTFENNSLCDCVLFKLVKYYQADGHTENYNITTKDVLGGSEAFEASLTWKIHGLYIVRASIHKQYPYDETALLFSDDNTTRLHYLHSREVRFCDGIYYYRQHKESATHAISLLRFDYLIANESMKIMMVDEKVSDYLIDIYENHRWLNVVDLYFFYYCHRHELSPADRTKGLSIIHEAWGGIECRRLQNNIRYRFGHIPFKMSWTLFRIEEEIYFFLRGLVGRNG